jgi:transcriptional regulator with XRE-family HTH domain
MKVTRPERHARVDDFRTFLGARLRAARKRNPRFSLRAFARRLCVDHSTLSQILRGTRRLTSAQAALMGKRLGLAADAIQQYARDLDAAPARTGARRVRRLSFDAETFALLSVWHHCAILELTRVDGFTTDSRWIANRARSTRPWCRCSP